MLYVRDVTLLFVVMGFSSSNVRNISVGRLCGRKSDFTGSIGPCATHSVNARRAMRARGGCLKPSAGLTMEEMLRAVEELDPPKGINQLVLPTAAPGRLLNKATSFIDEHRIRGYEVGPDQRTNILTIANLLQVRCKFY